MYVLLTILCVLHVDSNDYCLCYCHVDPEIIVELLPSTFTGATADSYNSFSLSCTATKPQSVVPALELNWYHNNTQLDASVDQVSITGEERRNAAEISSVLSIVAAQTGTSGDYTCVVDVTIPESSPVQVNQTGTVTIRGKYISMQTLN